MKKILIINAMALRNYGGRGVIKGAIRSLANNIPGAQITLMSSHYKKEYMIYENWNYENVQVIDHNWYREANSGVETLLFSSASAFYIFLNFAFYRCFKKILPLKNPYQQYDLIIDLNTDSLNDHYGPFSLFFSLTNTFLALIVGKPVAVCGASIGKFEKWSTKMFAKFVLNRVDLITVREEITREYLQKLGIEKPVYLTADHAFLMEPATIKRVSKIFACEGIDKDKRPIIGISTSWLIHRYAFPNILGRESKYKKFLSTMIETIEYLIEMDFIVILIPHSSKASTNILTKDDYTIFREIYEQAKNKDKIKLITGEYDADEVKGIIGACDMFIGHRMHATIAATSMGVPTIAVVFGHKSHGIIGKMMGQEDCLIEITKYDPDEFLSEMKLKIDYVWKNRDSIRIELKNKIKIVEEKAMLNGKLINELLIPASSDTI